MIDDPNGEVFAERVSRDLRAPVSADTSFVERVMSAVRVLPAAFESRSWWLRRRTVTFTPVAALGLAAGLALVFVGVSRVRPAPVPTAVATTDTVHLVRFVFTDSSARAVRLVGTFNDWSRNATPMERYGRSGVWSVTVAVPTGQHEYAFLVEDAHGERWVADPGALVRRDEFGSESSIVSVGRT